MRPRENIEKVIKKFNIDVNPEKDQEIFDELQQAQAKSKQSKPGISHIDLWRIIMKNRMTKLAAAAVILIAIYVCLQIPSSLLPKAYALQNTVEAYNSIRWLHIYQSEKAVREYRTELWLGCDEQGNVTRMRLESDNAGDSVGSLILAGNSDSSEVWLAKHNLHLVGYGDASIMLGFDVSELDPKLLIEKLLEQQDRDEVIVDIDEPEKKREPIIVTVTYPQGSRSENWKKVFHIDQATKLVIKIEKYKLRDQEFQLVKTLELFDYNQQIDQMMFTLKGDVPADAQVVDVTEVEAGLLQGDMTEEEIAVELTRQFFESVIARDFSRAGQLYLAAPDFLVEQAFMGANMVKIISVGPAHLDSDPDSDAMICSCKALAEFGGQYYDVDAWKVRVKRIDQDTNCWLISGTSISASPASDTITLSTDSADLNSATYDGLMPGEFMRKWLVLGPLPYPIRDDIYFASKEGQRVAFDTDSLDFLNFTPKVKIDNTDYKWAALESKYSIVDLNQLSEEKTDFNIAYVWAQIEMPEDRIGALGIGSDDGVKVWLNGELVHENWLYREVVSDNDRVPITFRKGTNQVVLKVQNALGPWGFCCRLLDE
ncbi:MAG: hypothetical protein AMJ75_04785 [Phycisphaerae bacterium SM1_79]|nr:MAG: hypothetical protein AMJ75_04785 [Phycisphaerae bacterium SM1_79]